MQDQYTLTFYHYNICAPVQAGFYLVRIDWVFQEGVRTIQQLAYFKEGNWTYIDAANASEAPAVKEAPKAPGGYHVSGELELIRISQWALIEYKQWIA